MKRTTMRQIRRKKGLTIKELADKTGINILTLIDLERGEEKEQPSAELWFKIATVLGTTIADILDLPIRKVT